MRFLFLFSLSFLFSARVSYGERSAPEGLKVVVQADHVNLRAQSNLTSEVLGQANWGDVLEAKRVAGEWVELLPPTNISFWVHGDFLHEERVVKPKRLNVRAGPGEHYSVVGRLDRGTQVRVLAASELWRQIAAPEGTSLWVARELVQLPTPKPTPKPTATPRPRPTPTPAPTPTPVIRTIEKIKVVEVEVPVRPEPTPTVRPPTGLDLVPLPGQGSRSMRVGYLKSYLLAGTSPSRFQLVQREANDRVRTLCYLHVNAEQLEGLFGRRVKVSGRDFWVRDSTLPVMVPETFEIVERDAEP